MNVKLLLESGLFERARIRSGRIYREGNAPEYGVIFTTTLPRSEDDLGLNPNHMLGAFIGNKDVAETERDDFFEILGGYFYHDNYPDSPKTTGVFGIVLKPEFGMTEGGSTTINEKWKLEDPEKPFLDESHWSKPDSKFYGWTFIVELKEKEKFPKSHDEFKIFVTCPEIKDVSAVIGDCENDPKDNQLKRSVTLQASIGELVSTKWTWNFGDGQSESGAGSPPESIQHFYENKPESEPKLSLEGSPACGGTRKVVGLSEFDTFKKCPKCPIIKDIKVTIGECKTEGEIRRRMVTFAPLIEGDEPDSWIWHFGDGTNESGNGKPPDVINHFYEDKPKSEPKLSLEGPPACGGTHKVVSLSEFDTYKKCPKCPIIKDIKVTIGECKTEGEIRRRMVTFAPLIEGDEPDSWIWHFGDGTNESGKGTPPDVITHFYEKTPQTSPKLSVVGPNPCNEYNMEVDLSQFEECPPCPKITHLGHDMSDKGENFKAVKFTAVVKDGKPDEFTWDWGNGSAQETTTKPTVSHDFKIPVSGSDKHTVSVTSAGPGDCQDCYKTSIDIPAREIPVPPKLCFLWPLIVAFLMATTFCSFIVYRVANTFVQAQDYDWLALVISVFAFLTIIAIIIWYQLAKKIPCPAPCLRDWFGIGWVVMLAGLLVANYVRDCCSAWWWVIIIILLVLAVFLFYTWYKKYKVTITAIIFHAIACFLAAAFVSYLIAYNLFVECL